MYKNNSNPEIEKTLETYYQAATPSAEFLDKLELQLNQSAEEIGQTRARQGILESLATYLFKQPKTRWVYAPVAIALLLVVMVSVIGPSRVLAEVQGWLRYVPGYGFVDEEAARALASPIAETRDGVTVTIKQVLADQQETYLVVNVEGGPSEDEIFEYMQPLPGEDLQARMNRGQALYETDARLTLPDGTILEDLAYGGSYWDGFFIFEKLPQNVLGATFEVSRLPGIPVGWLPEGWTFDLTLEYVDEPDTLEFPEPLYINAVSEPLHGFYIRVLDVVYADTEISIRVQVDGLPEGWVLQSGFLDARLADDLGREYSIIYGPRSGRDQDGIYTITFSPPKPDASKLTLSIVELFVEVSVQNQFVHVDFGDSPTVGDVFALDTTADVLGQQVTVKSVQIQDEPPLGTTTQGEDTPPTNTIAFELAIPEEDSGVAIHGLNFGQSVFSVFGKQTGGMSGSMADPENPGQLQFVLSIDIPEDQPLPTGAYDLPIESATVLFKGPYQITWDIGR